MGRIAFRRRKFAKEFFSYLLCAVFATGADWISFGIFFSFFSNSSLFGGESLFAENPEVIGVMLSYTMGGITNYILNKIFTYRDKIKSIRRQIVIYIAIMAGSYFLTALMMFVAVRGLSLEPIGSRMVITGCVFFYNFFMHRNFTFNKALYRPKGPG